MLVVLAIVSADCGLGLPVTDADTDCPVDLFPSHIDAHAHAAATETRNSLVRHARRRMGLVGSLK
jgi:hypothetical protein